MRRTFIVARRVLNQLAHNHRFLVFSILAPLLIVYFLKLFFDTLPPGFPVARYAIPVAAFLVHFLAFLLTAIVLVQERTRGTLEYMFINGFRRTEIIGGYVLGYLGLATLQAAVALGEVVWLFSLDYGVAKLLALFSVIWLLAIASVMLGIFVSTFARSESQIFPFIPLIIVPSVFLSGLLIDANRLPAWAYWLGHLLPLYYANAVVQEIISQNPSFSPVRLDLLALMLYGLVLLLIASRTLRELE